MICLRPDLLNTETVQYHHIIFQSVQFQINTDVQPTFSPVRIASEKYKLYSMCDCFCASTDLLFSLYHIAIGKCKKGIMQVHDPVKRGEGSLWFV